MSDQSGPTILRARFESALKAYQTTTGVTLAEHPLAVEMQGCHSAESIATLLKHEARAFTDLQGSDRVISSIKRTSSIFSTLSVNTILGEAIGLVRQET
jgi:hypothetical protein